MTWKDGTPTKVTVLTKDLPDLAGLQELVGGYIEPVGLGDGRIMLVDEEGRLKHPDAFNHDASILAGRPIVGDVVVLQDDALAEFTR